MRFYILLLFVLLVCKEAKQQPIERINSELKPIQIYQENLLKAKSDKKIIFLLFGANWCVDCRALDNLFKQERFLKLFNEKFILQKVDVGEFNKNLDFVEKFGNPIDVGIPSLVFVNSEGKIIAQTISEIFTSASKINPDKAYDYLNKL
jgi:thiol:disulfide interchange protein